MEELIGLWFEWFNGGVHTQTLWGLPLLFWARFGKIVALISNITLLLELIGSKPFEEMRASFKRLSDRLRPVDFFLGAIALLMGVFSLERKYLERRGIHKMYSGEERLRRLRQSNRELDEVDSEIEKHPAYRFRWPATWILWAGFLFISSRSLEAGFSINYLCSMTLLAGIGFFFAFVFRMIFLALINLVLMGILLLFELLTLRPLIYILQKERLGTAVKLGSLVFILVGFHFDLLAS